MLYREQTKVWATKSIEERNDAISKYSILLQTWSVGPWNSSREMLLSFKMILSSLLILEIIAFSQWLSSWPWWLVYSVFSMLMFDLRGIYKLTPGHLRGPPQQQQATVWFRVNRRDTAGFQHQWRFCPYHLTQWSHVLGIHVHVQCMWRNEDQCVSGSFPGFSEWQADCLS